MLCTMTQAFSNFNCNVFIIMLLLNWILHYGKPTLQNIEATFDIFFDSLLNLNKTHTIFLLWFMDNIHETRPSWVHHVVHKKILPRLRALQFTSNKKFAPSPHNKLAINEILSNTLKLLFDLVIQIDDAIYPKNLVSFYGGHLLYYFF
jgi:hypothetical protein